MKATKKRSLEQIIPMCEERIGNSMMMAVNKMLESGRRLLLDDGHIRQSPIDNKDKDGVPYRVWVLQGETAHVIVGVSLGFAYMTNNFHISFLAPCRIEGIHRVFQPEQPKSKLILP